MSSRADEKVAAMELFSVVCRAGGVMELGRAMSSLSKRSTSLVQSVGAVNFISISFTNIFKVLRPDESRVEVEAIMPLKFCIEAAEKNGCLLGIECVRLHLCPYFIRGKCTYGEKCRRSHLIKDHHTMSMLYALNLEDIDDVLWLQLLKKVLADTEMERGASTHDIPEICKFYQYQGGCRMKDKCAFLHVCQHFVDGTCKFGNDCKRDHDLLQDKHNREVFEEFKLLSANRDQLLYIMRGRERKRTTSSGSDSSIPGAASSLGYKVSNMSPHSTSAAVNTMNSVSQPAQAQATSSTEKQSTDICGFHLRGQCNYGQKCMNLHKDLPYQWQLQDASSSQSAHSGWKDLQGDWNIMLERAYCEPSTNATLFYHQGQSFKTDFDKMNAVAEQGQG
jgi:poly [ADP-ribose] polymerase 7/11/12/13